MSPAPVPLSPPLETAEKVAALWYQAWGVEVRGSVTREPAMLKPTEYVVLTDLDCQIFEAIVPADHYLRRVQQTVDFGRFRALLLVALFPVQAFAAPPNFAAPRRPSAGSLLRYRRSCLCFGSERASAGDRRRFFSRDAGPREFQLDLDWRAERAGPGSGRHPPRHRACHGAEGTRDPAVRKAVGM